MLLGILTYLELIPIIGGMLQPFISTRFAKMSNAIDEQKSTKYVEIFKDLFSKLLVKIAILNSFVLLVFFAMRSGILHLGVTHNIEFLADKTKVTLLFLIPFLIFVLGLWLVPNICLFNPELTLRKAIRLSFSASVNNFITIMTFNFFFLLITIAITSLFALILLLVGVVIMVLGHHLNMVMISSLLGIAASLVLFALSIVMNIASYYIYKDFFNKVEIA